MREKEPRMGLVVLLLLLALLFGGVGLFVEGLKWALIIALALVIAGAFTGSTYHRRGSAL
jgi:CHASE2 domain-containing sensor protein